MKSVLLVTLVNERQELWMLNEQLMDEATQNALCAALVVETAVRTNDGHLRVGFDL